jgi:hypothetical protein
VSERTLEGYRRYGGGPVWHRLGCGDGSRISYALQDLAEWILSRREDW